MVNPSERIILMIDEAHRTQGSDLGDNVFEAFPSATRIAFTGTPLITEQHGTRRTVKRFGEYIDTYKLMILHDGRHVADPLRGTHRRYGDQDKHGFDTKFEDLFKERSEEEILAIKKKYGAAAISSKPRAASRPLRRTSSTTTSTTSCLMDSKPKSCAIRSWPLSVTRNPSADALRERIERSN